MARDLIEQKAIVFKWMPNSHMLADMLTKATVLNEVAKQYFATGRFSMVPTPHQEKEEAYRLRLRRGQRERAKERKQAKKLASSQAAASASASRK